MLVSIGLYRIERETWFELRPQSIYGLFERTGIYEVYTGVVRILRNDASSL
jgi:hypothetical protein